MGWRVRVWLFCIGLAAVAGLVYYLGPSRGTGIALWVLALFIFVAGVLLSPQRKTAVDIQYRLREREARKEEKRKKRWWGRVRP